MKKLLITFVVAVLSFSCNKDQVFFDDMSGSWHIKSLKVEGATSSPLNHYSKLPQEGVLLLENCTAKGLSQGTDHCFGSFQFDGIGEFEFEYIPSKELDGEKSITIGVGQIPSFPPLDRVWEIVVLEENKIELVKPFHDNSSSNMLSIRLIAEK